MNEPKYHVMRKIGKGSFGAIYQGIVTKSGEEIAIKIESSRIPISLLPTEHEAYLRLQGGVGIPKVHWFGPLELERRRRRRKALVMELLGSSVEDTFELSSRRLSVQTVLMLADQMITRLQHVHSKGIIHRDIKPSNFLMGRGSNSSTVYIIDFGFAQEWMDPHTQRHIPYREGRCFLGTERYASINTHLEKEASRRDDLESLGYVFVYLLRGSLPWQGLKKPLFKGDRQCSLVADKKMSVSVTELCKGLPDEFATFSTYVKSLPFEAEPDYSFCRSLFRKLFITNGYRDAFLDWQLHSGLSTLMKMPPAPVVPNELATPSPSPAATEQLSPQSDDDITGLGESNCTFSESKNFPYSNAIRDSCKRRDSDVVRDEDKLAIYDLRRSSELSVEKITKDASAILEHACCSGSAPGTRRRVSEGDIYGDKLHGCPRISQDRCETLSVPIMLHKHPLEHGVRRASTVAATVTCGSPVTEINVNAPVRLCKRISSSNQEMMKALLSARAPGSRIVLFGGLCQRICSANA